MKPRTVTAVIVTFNRLEKLKETLENTLDQAFYRVVVVNNCSTDGTTEWLNQVDDERVHVIHSPENQGGAGGFHKGFDFAAQQLPDADWLVAFDDDAYPEPGTLEQFQALEIPEDVGSVAAAVYLPDGRISEMNRPSVNPFWHLKKFFSTALSGRQGFHVSDDDYRLKTHREIDASSFVGFFLRLSLIREGKIGLPRAELFIYADDIIYVLEMRKTGARHWFVPWMRFEHDCETLINGVEAIRPIWKVYFMYRNRIEMYRIAAGKIFPIVLLVKVSQFFFAARYYHTGERISYLRIASFAVCDGVFRRYHISPQKLITKLDSMAR